MYITFSLQSCLCLYCKCTASQLLPTKTHISLQCSNCNGVEQNTSHGHHFKPITKWMAIFTVYILFFFLVQSPFCLGSGLLVFVKWIRYCMQCWYFIFFNYINKRLFVFYRVIHWLLITDTLKLSLCLLTLVLCEAFRTDLPASFCVREEFSIGVNNVCSSKSWIDERY